MSDHFTLDVDPSELSLAITKLTWLATHLTDEGGKLGRSTGSSEGWSGVAAEAVHAEMGTLATAMTTTSAPKATAASHAVTTFRTSVEEALTQTLPSLNKQWDTAQSDHQSAITKATTAYTTAKQTTANMPQEDKDAAKKTHDSAVVGADIALGGRELWLDGQYDLMMIGVRHAARSCASALRTASPITFSDSQWTKVRGGHLSLADLAALRGEAFGQKSILHMSDIFRTAEDAQKRIAGGESPASVLGDMDPAVLAELIQRGLVNDSQVAAALADDPKVKAALAAIRDFGQFPFGGSDYLKALEGLTAAQRQAVLATLSDSELKKFWESYAPFPGTGGHWGTMDMETYLLSVTSPATVNRLVTLLGLNPKLPKGATYGVPKGPFDKGNEWVLDKLTGKWIPGTSPKSWTDINQGQIGDCWFLAALAALGHDRGDGAYDTIANQNLNGTVSVQLYDGDGHPHLVTVDKQLPLTGSGSSWGAHGDQDWGPNDETWPAYVEKAMAHSYGTSNDYESIDSDTAGHAVKALTGGNTHGVGDGSGWFGIGGSNGERVSHIKSELAQGHSVFVSTKGGDDDHKLLGGRVVSGHLYFVRDVLPDGRVVLFNPWGLNADPPSVVVTADELAQISSGVDATNDG